MEFHQIKRRRFTQSEVVDRMNGDAGSSDDLEIISVAKREASIRKLNHGECNWK